ncbi:MAG: hypothetical protein HKP56_01045 [Anderseniella sp.]|nr:hypothetical protein [Anderseniella sp.]
MFNSINSTTVTGLAIAGALAFATFVSPPASEAPVPGAAFAHSGLETTTGKVIKAHIRKRGFRSRKFQHRRFGHRRGFRSRGFGRHGYYASPYYYRDYGLRRSYGYRGYGRGFGRGPVSGGR